MFLPLNSHGWECKKSVCLPLELPGALSSRSSPGPGQDGGERPALSWDGKQIGQKVD